MEKKRIFLIVILCLIVFGLTLVIAGGGKTKGSINVKSMCYTNLQPSKYFKDSPNPFQIYENGIKIFIDDEFSVEKGSTTGSMRPTFRDNSYYILIKPKKQSDLNIGDVISINRIGEKNLLHRIIRIENDLYITKGDNNNVEDTQKWRFEDINGKVIGVLY